MILTLIQRIKLPANQRKNYSKLKKILGFSPRKWDYYQLALTHSSVCNDYKSRLQNNERLEFLGDAVLEIVSSEFLFHNYPNKPEGALTKLRASIVCEPTLALCTEEIELGNYIFLGKGEEQTGGRKRKSILSDALEAVIGAIYLDGGFANAKEFIHKFVLNDLENKKLFYDSKTILQEMVQGVHGKQVLYKLVKEEGPDHNKSFTVEAYIGDLLYGEGTGRTKKAAEQEAAYHAILKLRKGNKE